MFIADEIEYVGVNDHRVDLFEGQYKVPHGMSYNSYVVKDEKIAVMIRWTRISRANGWKICNAFWAADNPIISSCSTWSPITPQTSPCSWKLIQTRKSSLRRRRLP